MQSQYSHTRPHTLPDDFYLLPVRLTAQLVQFNENTLRSYILRGFVKTSRAADGTEPSHAFSRMDLIRLRHFLDLHDLGVKPATAGTYVNTFFDCIPQLVLSSPVKYVVYHVGRPGPLWDWVCEDEGIQALDGKLPGIVVVHKNIADWASEVWQHGPAFYEGIFSRKQGRRDDATDKAKS